LPCVRSPEHGMELNAVRERLEATRDAAARRISAAELERALTQDRVDVTLPSELLDGDRIVAPRRGAYHPTTQIRRIVEDAFLGLGYEIRDDREVETVEYNFDKLAFPEWHPTRSPRDTLFLDENTLLRTETSPSQIHQLEEHEPPVYMVSIGRV